MKALKRFLKIFINKIFFQRILAYLLLIGFFYVFHDFILVFFLTFIFSYLFLSSWEFLKKKLDIFIDKHKFNKKYKKIFSLNLLIALEYILFITILAFTVSNIIPKLITELSALPDKIPFLKDQLITFTDQLKEIKDFNAEVVTWVEQFMENGDYEIFLQVFENVKQIWLIVFKFVLSLILSFIFILDRHKLQDYFRWVQGSNFRFLYDEYSIIIEKLTRSFWLLFKAQAMIAIVNAVLTSIWLYLLGLFFYPAGFPYILTLAVIVFIFGFIPVFWTFLSSVPIAIIAFTIWGFSWVLQIVVLVALVHAIEAYYLNPKIISSYMELPVSMTFIILLIWEHFFGVAGLIIWVSWFYFIVDLFKDFDKVVTKTNNTLHKNKKVADEAKQLLAEHAVTTKNNKKSKK